MANELMVKSMNTGPMRSPTNNVVVFHIITAASNATSISRRSERRKNFMLILNEFFRLLIMEFSYLASNGYTYSRENGRSIPG